MRWYQLRVRVDERLADELVQKLDGREDDDGLDYTANAIAAEITSLGILVEEIESL